MCTKGRIVHPTCPIKTPTDNATIVYPYAIYMRRMRECNNNSNYYYDYHYYYYYYHDHGRFNNMVRDALLGPPINLLRYPL